MMRILLLFLLNPTIYVAQMIDPKRGEPFSDKPFFDDEFINWQKIKSLKGTYIYMMSDGAIRNTKYALCFEFDTLGRLSYQYETCKDDGTADTSWNYYSYNDKSQLIKHTSCYKQSCKSNESTWDENGFLKINQEVNNEYNKNPEINYRDSLITQSSDDFIIQKFYNNTGGYYLIEETQIDYMMRPLFKSRRYVNTSEVWNEAYQYNENGKLLDIKRFKGIDTSLYTEQTYEYNNLGSLLKYTSLKNGNIIQETEFLYNDRGILESLITQNYDLEMITVIRFSEISFY
jgi:hypothetical protein